MLVSPVRFAPRIGPGIRSQRKCTSRLCCYTMSAVQIAKKQKTAMVQESVKLSEEEQKIFDTLLHANRHFNLGTQLRVAGGWVRDKLLGKDCYDIDIALDNMLGKDFCEKVNEYLKSIGEETHNVGVIMSNPDQSKHLETARMRVRGVWVDFVNLRAETYADNSRIPTMEFGTPTQDAERRDLTINSLFFNINSGQVEDFTEKGMNDLKAGIIATPLEPRTTFLDDPLRVLRAVRFGARFGFELNEDLKVAASSEDVRSALGKKISRERIGHEIELMLMGNEPALAMKLLLDLKLFPVVFSPPIALQGPLPNGWERKCVHALKMAWDLLSHFGPSKLTSDHKRLFWFSALLFPLRDSKFKDHKKKVFPTTSFIIRESLKLKNNDVDGVASLHQSAEEFVIIKSVLLASETSCAAGNLEEVQRVKTGLLLMKIKDLWRAALLLSALCDSFDEQEWDAKSTAASLTSFEDMIAKLGLEKAWDMKLLLDGNEIMRELNLKGGPAVKKWKEFSIEWQLAHPNGTAAECRDWLKLQHASSS